MIAHPIFFLLGVTQGDDISSVAAVMVIGIYIAFGLVALAIDRRALLVSALAYVLFALTQLFQTFGAVALNVALPAFWIGSALLPRAEERRVGNEGDSMCSSRWSREQSKK